MACLRVTMSASSSSVAQLVEKPSGVFIGGSSPHRNGGVESYGEWNHDGDIWTRRWMNFERMGHPNPRDFCCATVSDLKVSDF